MLPKGNYCEGSCPCCSTYWITSLSNHASENNSRQSRLVKGITEKKLYRRSIRSSSVKMTSMGTVTEVSNTTAANLSFIKSNKGQPLLVMNDYVYKCNKKSAKRKYWVCIVSGCLMYVHTTLDDVHIDSGQEQHDHSQNSELIEVKRVRQQIKERALTELIPVGMIYDEQMAKVNMSV